MDSGCTDHIINDANYYENCIDLKEPINVHLGDKRSVKATKIGNVVSFFEAFGKLNRVDIKNVYFAKDMSNNLISYEKITDNSTIISRGNESRTLNEFGNLTTIVYENEIEKRKFGQKNINENKNKNVNVPSRKSSRNKNSPIRYPENECNNIYVNFCKINTPNSYEEAINSEDCTNWVKAMDNEIDCLDKNDTWILVNRDKNKHVLDVKWFCTIKSKGKYRARLVVHTSK